MRDTAVRRAITFGLACCVIPACFLGEHQVNTYDTVDAARSDRLFERGWVPDVLPPGSGPIIEAHDLDTSSRCSKSSFSVNANRDVQAALRSLGFEAEPGERLPVPIGICPFDAGEVANGGVALVRQAGQSGGREVAVLAKGSLYFWSSSR